MNIVKSVWGWIFGNRRKHYDTPEYREKISLSAKRRHAREKRERMRRRMRAAWTPERREAQRKRLAAVLLRRKMQSANKLEVVPTSYRDIGQMVHSKPWRPGPVG